MFLGTVTLSSSVLRYFSTFQHLFARDMAQHANDLSPVISRQGEGPFPRGSDCGHPTLKRVLMVWIQPPWFQFSLPTPHWPQAHLTSSLRCAGPTASLGPPSGLSWFPVCTEPISEPRSLLPPPPPSCRNAEALRSPHHQVVKPTGESHPPKFSRLQSRCLQ